MAWETRHPHLAGNWKRSMPPQTSGCAAWQMPACPWSDQRWYLKCSICVQHSCKERGAAWRDVKARTGGGVGIAQGSRGCSLCLPTAAFTSYSSYLLLAPLHHHLPPLTHGLCLTHWGHPEPGSFHVPWPRKLKQPLSFPGPDISRELLLVQLT